MRDKKIRQCDFWIVITLLWTVIFVYMISVNVLGKESDQGRFDEQYYQVMEKEYRQSLRQCLEQSGYPNSGITMIKTVNHYIGAFREYSVLIYNKKIDRLTEQERNELMTDIAGITFPIEGCTVFHDFLETDFIKRE